METEMATFTTDRIATQLAELAATADLYPGDPIVGARIAQDIADTVGPCAVHPNMDVRDAYIVLTAHCGITALHAAENAFSSDQTAPSDSARALAEALRGHPEVVTLTLEVPSTDGKQNGAGSETYRV